MTCRLSTVGLLLLAVWCLVASPAWTAGGGSLTPDSPAEKTGNFRKTNAKKEKKSEGEKNAKKYEEYHDSVVRISPLGVFYSYNSQRPWQRPGGHRSIYMAGSFLQHNGKKYILTTNDLQLGDSLWVSRQGTTRKFLARPVSGSFSTGLALLEVDNPKFWAGARFLELGDVPEIGDKVDVLGFSLGFDQASTVSGAINRLVYGVVEEQVAENAPGAVAFHPQVLMLQSDMRGNYGDDGGPALSKDGKLVGVVSMGHFLDAALNERIFHLISTPAIRKFLEDFDRNGKYVVDGPSAGAEFLNVVENPMLAKFYGIDKSVDKLKSVSLKHNFSKDSKPRGVLIANFDKPWFDQQRAQNPDRKDSIGFEKDDILMQLNGVEVAYDGSVPYSSAQKLPFLYALQDMDVGDDSDAVVWRNGELKEITIPLPPKNRTLIDMSFGRIRPTYFFYGGLLFGRVTAQYTGNDENVPKEATFKLQDGDEYVTVFGVWGTKTSIGLEYMRGKRLKRVNGKLVRSINHLIDIIEKKDVISGNDPVDEDRDDKDEEEKKEDKEYEKEELDDDMVKFEFSGNFVVYMNGNDVEAEKQHVMRTLGMSTDRYIGRSPPLPFHSS